MRQEKKMKIKVKEYLEGLASEQAQKPVTERLPIPTVKVLAEAAGITKAGMYDFLNREHKKINLDILAAILIMCRHYGHNTTLDDIIEYDEEMEAWKLHNAHFQF
jgi:DNA-binding Xre family transcriptional regulator